MFEGGEEVDQKPKWLLKKKKTSGVLILSPCAVPLGGLMCPALPWQSRGTWGQRTKWCRPQSYLLHDTGESTMSLLRLPITPSAHRQWADLVLWSLLPHFHVFRKWTWGRADRAALAIGNRQCFSWVGALGDGLFRIHSSQMFTLFRLNYVSFLSDLLFVLYIVPRVQGNAKPSGFPHRAAPTKFSLSSEPPTP